MTSFTNPYYIPKYYYNNNLYYNNNHYYTNYNYQIFNTQETKIKQNENFPKKEDTIEIINLDESEEEEEQEKESIKLNIKKDNFPDNKNIISKNDSYSINPIELEEVSEDSLSDNSDSNKNSSQTNFSPFNNNNINLSNTTQIMINNKNFNNNVNKENKKLTFEESMKRLKSNYFMAFENISNEGDNICESENFRKIVKNNKNMKLIFEYNDIIKELYEKKIESKIKEKNCDINKVIDIYINKMKKLSNKRNIVIKDYKNYIFVIGVEMMVNLKDKVAKEFIVKKMTETYKGNCKIDTEDDNCYIIETNNQNKSQLIYNTKSSVYISLSMLLQNMYKNASFK